MKRLFALLVVWSAVALGVAQAVPDRKPLEPELPKRPKLIDLRGTTWEGKDHVENYRVTFEPDGTLTYGYKNKYNHGGTWLLEGNQVYWEVNKKFRETKALVSDDTIAGEAWNKTGKRWPTLLKRIK